jgi:signal peptidase I
VSAQSVEGETDSGQGPPSTPLTRRTPSSYRGLLLTLLAVAAVVVLVRVFLVQTFVIPSGSMEPGLQVGDRVVVSRLDYRFGGIRRGDVVVFDGDGVFTPAAPPGSLLTQAGRTLAQALGAPAGESDFVKRVVGLGGDHVVCCDHQGRITVNGRPLEEPYIYPGDDPSDLDFDEVVPPGHLWMMGDHRSSSADSREHLGDPGGGMVPVDRVVGRVVAVWWPWSRATGVGRAAAQDPRAPGASGSAARTAPADRAVSPGREATP